jgi:hypothetical protein
MNFVGKTGHYTTGPTHLPVPFLLPGVAQICNYNQLCFLKLKLRKANYF